MDPCGYDAGKRIKGKKRHVLVDTQGLLMQAVVHAADIQDRDGGVLVMASLFGLYPFLLKLYADGGYQGAQFKGAPARHAPSKPGNRQEIGRRQGFHRSTQALDRRENHRLARSLPKIGQGLRMSEPQRPRFPALASIRLMLRKLCR
jgi:transposase